MSLINTDRTTAGMAAISARAKDAAAQAVPMGTRAGTTAVQGVQGAMDWAAPRISDAVFAAREWAAPQLENAADAVTTTGSDEPVTRRYRIRRRRARRPAGPAARTPAPARLATTSRRC